MINKRKEVRKMKSANKSAKSVLPKCGKLVANIAFMSASIAANSSCLFPFYEPEEPKNLDKLKKFNK